MPARVILGLQWGDEGKGKLVDALSDRHELICRFQGGPNAGHTIYAGGQRFVLHQIPSGIFHPGKRCIIGNGVVLNPITLHQELQQLQQAGYRPHQQLFLSARAHLILPSHCLLDRANETHKGDDKIGSTLRGISPAYQDKYARVGLRVGDLLAPDFHDRLNRLLERHQQALNWLTPDRPANAREGLEDFLEATEALKALNITDTEVLINHALSEGAEVLVEGAQGTLLDIDFGSYPYVTSSNTIAGGAATGLGIAPRYLNTVTGVFKAYCTRVGNGPFPTELNNAEGEALRKQGGEFGATTGRPRRTGWLDLPALRYAVLLSGVTELSIMKVDILAGLPQVKVCIHYERHGEAIRLLPARHDDPHLRPVYHTMPGWAPFAADGELPRPLELFLQFIEREVNVPVRYVSMGPERHALRKRLPAGV